MRYLFLSISSNDNADIFATFLLILYCRFSFLVILSVVMISFYILSKRFHRKRKGLSDARAVSLTKRKIVLKYIFYKDL